MNTALSLRRAIRLAIGGAAALAAPFVATNALAQAETPEEVVVTGSRIARGSDFESPSPVITVDRDAIERSIAGSQSYAVLRDGTQVAFARAVTDGATFAWVCDVFVDEAHRGRGLGTWLVDSIVEDLTAAGVPRILLATRDAQEVYARSGFTVLDAGGRYMEIDHRPTRAAILGLS